MLPPVSRCPWTARHFSQLKLVFAWLALSAPVAAAPIPTDPDTPTKADYLKELLTTATRGLDVYDRSTADAEKIRADVKKFLVEFERSLWEAPGFQSWEALHEVGTDLLKRGSRDPLFKVYFARVRLRVPNTGVRYELELWARLDEFAKSTYPPLWKLEPLLQMQPGWEKRIPRGKPSAQDLIVQLADAWIGEPDRTEAERRFRWERIDYFFSNLDIELAQLFLETCEKHLDADPWLLNMLGGSFHDRLAEWIEDQGRKAQDDGASYEEQLRLAAGYLQSAWQIDPRIPTAPALMIRVATRQNEPLETRRMWFDRTVAAQMDLDLAYNRYFDSLYPGWGGSIELMYAFTHECLATERFDTGVPHMGVLLIRKADWYRGAPYESFKEDEIWRVVDQVYQAILAGGDRDYLRWDSSYMITQWMMFALKSDRYEDAGRILKMADERSLPLNSQALDEFHLRTTSAEAMVRATSGPAATTAQKVLPRLQYFQRVDADLRDETLELLDALLAADSHPRVQDWFGRWQKTLRWERDYDAGKWVELDFVPGLVGWLDRSGTWTAQDDGSLTCMLKPGVTYMELLCNGRFPGPIELQADLSVPSDASQPVSPAVHLRVDDFQRDNEPSEVRSFWVSPIQQRAGISDYGKPFLGAQVDVQRTGPNHIRLLSWDTLDIMQVNGLQLPIKPRPALPERDMISLGGAFWLDRAATARFANLRIRKLTIDPPPPAGDYQAQFDYYSKLLAEDADDEAALWRRGLANFGLQRLPEARADLERLIQRQPKIAQYHCDLGVIADSLHDYELALAEYRRSLEINKDTHAAMRGIIWIQASCPDAKYRDGAAALEQAKQLCELTKFRDWQALACYSAALAEVGRHDEAITQAQKALAAAPRPERPAMQRFLARRQAREPERPATSSEPAPKTADEKPGETE